MCALALLRLCGLYSVGAVDKSDEYRFKVGAYGHHTDDGPAHSGAEVEHRLTHVDAALGLDTECECIAVTLVCSLDSLYARDLFKSGLYLFLRAADLDLVAIAVLDGLGEVFGTLVSDDLTLVDDYDPLADSLYLSEDVGGKNDGVALTEGTDKVSDLKDLLGVKAYGRLVKHDDLRVANKSLRDTNTLLITL